MSYKNYFNYFKLLLIVRTTLFGTFYTIFVANKIVIVLLMGLLAFENAVANTEDYFWQMS